MKCDLNMAKLRIITCCNQSIVTPTYDTKYNHKNRNQEDSNFSAITPNHISQIPKPFSDNQATPPLPPPPPLTLQSGDALVCHGEMVHHLVQAALPLTAGARTGALVRPTFARLLVGCLLCVQQQYRAAGGDVLTGEHYRRRHLLHRQVPDVACESGRRAGGGGK